MDKTTNSDLLDLAYAEFLKVLNDVGPKTDKGLIYLNRYLDPAWFEGSNYDVTKLATFYTILALYISTTDTPTRNAKHLEVVNYLNNTTVSGLFLQTPLRTKAYFKASEYTDGGDISATYVNDANSSANVGSHSYTPTMM